MVEAAGIQSQSQVPRHERVPQGAELSLYPKEMAQPAGRTAVMERLLAVREGRLEQRVL